MPHLAHGANSNQPLLKREKGRALKGKERDALSAVVFDAALGGVWRKKLEADTADPRNRKKLGEG